MKYLNPLILESKQIGNLYHFTSEINAYLILDKMEMKASSFYDDDSDLWRKEKYKYRISFTRNRNLWKELSYVQKINGNIKMDTRLKFDGDILSNHYKIVAHDDNWKRDNRFKNTDFSKNNKSLSKRSYDLGDEREERLYTNKKYIDITYSLKEITLFRDNYKMYQNWLEASKLKNDFIKKCEMYKVKLNIYLKEDNETIEII